MTYVITLHVACSLAEAMEVARGVADDDRILSVHVGGNGPGHDHFGPVPTAAHRQLPPIPRDDGNVTAACSCGWRSIRGTGDAARSWLDHTRRVARGPRG